MPTSSVDLDELARLARDRSEVKIVVSDCLYACCGARAWLPRQGYEQTYRGVLADVDIPEDRYLLHAIAIGTLSYCVSGALSKILDLEALVD